jgi:hypothetical protein
MLIFHSVTEIGKIPEFNLLPLLISKMLTYTKRFLPNGTNIALPPNEDDVEAHRQYHHVIGNLGKNCQTEIMKFLKEYSNNNDFRISKCVLDKNTMWSTFNMFEKYQCQHFLIQTI